MNLGRHLLIAAGLLAAFVIGLLIRNWESVEAAFSNMTALAEGKEEAASLQLPADLLTYLQHHPDDVSLVAYDLGHEADGLFWNADVERATTGLAKLWTLAAYAKQVTAGHINPDTLVSVSEIANYDLPGINADGHARAMQRFGEADSVMLAQVVEAMMQDNHHAAADFLVMQLGDSALPQQVVPHSGLFLHWLDEAHDPLAQTRRLAEDAAFRFEAQERLRTQGLGLSIQQQRARAHATFPRSTATAYADLFARALVDSVAALRPPLEQPFPADTTGVAAYDAFAVHGGAFPGVISLGGYVRGPDGGRIVVLLLENVPLAVFYHLAQTSLDKGFVLQLLLDGAFSEEVREGLS